MTYSQNEKRRSRREQKRRHSGTTARTECSYLPVFLKKVRNWIKEMSYIRRRSCLQCGIILYSCWLHWKLIKQKQKAFICMISLTLVASTQHGLSSQELVFLLPQWPLCPIYSGCCFKIHHLITALHLSQTLPKPTDLNISIINICTSHNVGSSRGSFSSISCWPLYISHMKSDCCWGSES